MRHTCSMGAYQFNATLHDKGYNPKLRVKFAACFIDFARNTHHHNRLPTQTIFYRKHTHTHNNNNNNNYTHTHTTCLLRTSKKSCHSASTRPSLKGAPRAAW